MSDLPDLDAMPKVMGDDGQFHATDDEVDLSGTPVEAWVALAFFWMLGATVFYQFITRYVMNNSASWTEEIARYMLIATVFTGATIGVAKNNHIQVDFFYRFMPDWLGRVMGTLVDVMRIAFFAAATFLTGQMMDKLGSYNMTVIDLPMNIVYGVVLLAFVLMTWRSLWVMRRHWQQGYSVLERPENL
jgi:TRAP-type C4-dicarboxylate transport system permease small subunit